MKITKEIRQYIEDKVYEKMEQNPELIELKKQADAECEAWETCVAAIEAEASSKLQNLLARMNYQGNRFDSPAVRVQGVSVVRLPAYEKYRQEQDKLKLKARSVARDIAVELSIGGSAEELRSRLDALTF